MTATRTGLTRRELLDLPAVVDVETAAKAFGLGRTTAYVLAKTEAFPCAVIRAGKSYRVITADMLRVLQIAREDSDDAEVAPSAPSSERLTQPA
ncbi:DNA-binding protein [Streptomyces sp. NPDC051310]|uniref:DNA-binding protein n=1 Tax=Streptomyces sp. NPDC051310 TaxID=3365649 RepID=UPI0037AA35E8